MKTRRKAREGALQILFQCDALEEWNIDRISIFLEVFHPEWLEGEIIHPAEKENLSLMHLLASSVIEKKEEIDQCISGASNRWRVDRMCQVDRNILRIAVSEMLFCEEIPIRVSMNEAIEIARRYGAEDSPSFVNGVLDRVARDLEQSAAADPQSLSKIA